MHHNSGTKNSNAKLNEHTVRLIHAIKHHKKLKNQTIADLFDINKVTVAYVLKRKTWAHVELWSVEESGKMVKQFEDLMDPEKDYIEYRKISYKLGLMKLGDFMNSKKSKSTLWQMKKLSDLQGINGYRFHNVGRC